MKHKLAIVLSLATAFLAISSLIFVPAGDSGDMSIRAALADDTMIVDYQVAGGPYARSVTAVALEVSRVHQGPIFVLINEGLEFHVKVSLQRMVDHFNNELPLMGSGITATAIDVDELPLVFSDPQATLVVGPGADLPDYYSYPARWWVESGGLWISIGQGSAPFVYSQDNAGRPNATLRLDFVGAAYDGGAGITATPMAAALGLRYVAPEILFRLSDLDAAGGTSIGYEFDRGETLATAGMIPMGDGTLLVMAGDMNPPPLATGEEVLAWDLMRMVLLNVPWWSGNMRFETTSALGGDIRGNISLPLTGAEYVCYALMSNSDSFSEFRVQRAPVRGI